MSEKNMKEKRRIILISIVLIIVLIITNIISERRYDNLYQQYADQVIIHNDLLKSHTALTDAYWSLQQSIIKQ